MIYSVQKSNYKFILFILQFFCFITGIAFSAGGGNFPGQTQNNFGFYKAVLLLIPISAAVYSFIIRPGSLITCFIGIVRRNSGLFGYYFIALVTILFAVNPLYSLTRLFYTVFGFAVAISLLAQYRLYLNDIYLVRIINWVSFFILLFPLYIFCRNGFSFTDFRFALESLYLIHPNILAAFYAHLCLWHGMHILYSRKHVHKVYFFFFILLDYLLFSRAAIISLAIVLALLPFIYAMLCKNRKAFIIGLSVVLAGILAFITAISGIISVEAIASLFSRHDSLESLMTLTNRTVLWQHIMENMSTTVFLTGYGYSVIDKDFGVDLGTGILYGAHNTYLSVMLGSGIFALCAILIWFGRNFLMFFRNFEQIDRPLFLSVICSYLFFMMTSFFAEELGVSFSITFAYLFILTNFALFQVKEQK